MIDKLDQPADPVTTALLVLTLDAVDTEREAMWRYGVKHALGIVQSALALEAEHTTALIRAIENLGDELVQDDRGIPYDVISRVDALLSHIRVVPR